MEDILQVREEYRLQHWRPIVQQCRESGLSNRDFCRQNGITEKTYYYWLRKLRMAAACKEAPRIVELERQDSGEDMIYIRFRNAEMTLPAGTDADAITAILRSLQETAENSV